MKKIIVFVFCIISTGLNLNAQTEKAISDTTISFKVYGLCEMCKERIETAAKGRGVKLAEWDLESKILTLQYIPSQANITKIQNRIVGAGHDLENKKAKEAVYRELPPCCLYRDSVDVEHGTVKSSPPSQIVRGIILEASNKGKFNPLFNASIIWMGSNKGVFTDSLGYFEIEHPGTETNLVVSYTGYKSDTIAVANASEIKVVMTNNRQLKEVIVTNTQRSSFVATMST